jgi:hypothetical protein
LVREEGKRRGQWQEARRATEVEEEVEKCLQEVCYEEQGRHG